MSDSCSLFSLSDAAATETLGAALARSFLASGGGSAVVYWEGDLGAGKTTCVRSLLRALGVKGLIRSPTYTLVEVYPVESTRCVHVDLYRLQSLLEVDELGLRDYADGPCLLLVEWPDRGAGVLPPPDLEVRLQYRDAGRDVEVAGRSNRGRTWLRQLVHDASLTAYVSNLT